MDIVDCVTENSNNTETKLENQVDKWQKNQFNMGSGVDDIHFAQQQDTGTSHKFNMNSSIDSDDIPGINRTFDRPDVPNKSQVPDYLKAIGMDPRKFWPKKYRFTREKPPGQHNPMTVVQRNFYENNGYIVIDESVNKKLIETILGQHKNSTLINEHLVDKLVAKNEKLLKYAKCFCDDSLMLMTHRLISSFQTDEMAREFMDNKQFSRQQLYRDWVYLPFRPMDKVCCAVTAIEPLDSVILVVPGTHKIGQVTISSTINGISAAFGSNREKSSQLKEIFETSPERMSTLINKSEKGFKYINLKPGQTLFYHPGLVHGFSSDLVNFKKSQLSSIAYYAAADCEYIDLRSVPELMATNNELPISLAHFGDMNPSDYTSWIDKPILLCSKDANL